MSKGPDLGIQQAASPDGMSAAAVGSGKMTVLKQKSEVSGQ
jgi:hypothetical protein